MTAPKRIKTTNLRDPIRGDALDPVTGLLPAATPQLVYRAGTGNEFQLWNSAGNYLANTSEAAGYAYAARVNAFVADRARLVEALRDTLQHAENCVALADRNDADKAKVYKARALLAKAKP